MRHGTTPVISAILVTLASAMPAHAEHYSLDRAVTYALTHNPNLNAAHQQMLAAGADRQAAEGQRLPRLDLSYTARRSDNPLDAFADKLNGRRVTTADFQPGVLNDPGTSDLYATRLSLRLPIYTGGRLAAEIESAKQVETASSHQYQRRYAITAYRAQTAYYAVQAATRAVTIANAAVKAARRHADTTARLLKEGRIVDSDNLTARVYLASVEGVREQSRTNLNLARDHLALVMGLAADALVAVDPWHNPNPAYKVPSLAELEVQAVTHRRDLQSTQAMVDAAAAQVDAARAAYKPRFDLVASSNWYDDRVSLDNQSWSIAGIINMNLFSGGTDRSRVVARRYYMERVKAERAGQEQAIRNEVRAAYARLQETSRRLAIARNNVGRAARTVQLVDERYGQGRTILIDVLQAERALVETKHEALAAGLGVKNSIAQLRLADGELADPDGRTTP